MRKLLLSGIPLALVAGMLLPAADASAHEPGYRDNVRWSAPHYRHHHGAAVPRWVRRNHDFLRWYEFQPYRLIAHLSWVDLHRRYERDRYYHRHYKGQPKRKHKRDHRRDDRHHRGRRGRH